MSTLGFDDLINNMKKLQKNIKNLDGKHVIKSDDLFTASFMIKNTNYLTIDEFFIASGFKIENMDDLKAVPDQEWDEFIQAKTKFSSWEKMHKAAAGEWAKKRLGF